MWNVYYLIGFRKKTSETQWYREIFRVLPMERLRLWSIGVMMPLTGEPQSHIMFADALLGMWSMCCDVLKCIDQPYVCAGARLNVSLSSPWWFIYKKRRLINIQIFYWLKPTNNKCRISKSLYLSQENLKIIIIHIILYMYFYYIYIYICKIKKYIIYNIYLWKKDKTIKFLFKKNLHFKKTIKGHTCTGLVWFTRAIPAGSSLG